jgi:hypothetical protein
MSVLIDAARESDLFMAISRNFRNGSIWLKLSGEVSRRDLSEGILQAMADERFVESRFLILDFQDSKTDISSDDIQSLVSLLKGITDTISPPILTIVSDGFHFGLMRMFQSHAENSGFEVKILMDEKKVMQWLAVA